MTNLVARRGPLAEEPDRRLPQIIWLHDSFEAGTREFIVRGLLEPQSLAVLYGDSGSGKSTLAVDLGFAIATGKEWRDRPTAKGLVLHIAGEGTRGLRLRQAAYCQHYQMPRTAPYGVLTSAVPFVPNADTTLVPLVLEAARDLGFPPRLVIVDTLARCLVGDENAGPDMATFIRCCDYLRTATGAAILVLHHSGKDAAKGARGHSSLRAAVDTELQVEGTKNPRTLHVRKQRDLELGQPMGFRLEPIILSEDGEDFVSACVVVHQEAAPVVRAKPAGRNQVAATTALRQWCRTHGDPTEIDSIAITGLLSGQGIDRKRRPEVLNYLVNAGVLTPAVGGYTVQRASL